MKRYHPLTEWYAHVPHLSVFSCTWASHPIGASGILLQSKGLLRCMYAKMLEGVLDCWIRLIMILVCGSSQSQRFGGKLSATPAKMLRKWALKLRMATSAALCLWHPGGTNPISSLNVSLMWFFTLSVHHCWGHVSWGQCWPVSVGAGVRCMPVSSQRPCGSSWAWQGWRYYWGYPYGWPIQHITSLQLIVPHKNEDHHWNRLDELSSFLEWTKCKN